MEFFILIISILLFCVNLLVLFFVVHHRKNNPPEHKLNRLEESISRMENQVKDEFRYSRETEDKQFRQLGIELQQTLTAFRTEQREILRNVTEQNYQSMQGFQQNFSENMEIFNCLLREKLGELTIRQQELLQSTEKRLEEMRATVDEKLQKTLHERIGQSFELVSHQLENVQKGLGEMQTLAQDVGGLKRVLSNVKVRGTIGEIQLGMLLEQLLSPEQYVANVKTKHGSDTLVEFAIRLPGRDEEGKEIYLPVDAKFPKDIYEQLLDAYDSADAHRIDVASKNMEQTIKGMARNIHDKYLDPPNTTDFGIMFLPFESIYGEVVRRTYLLEVLQREYQVIVTGPTTFAAILNSLQMGFRTLAIQKRSGEVWRVLGAVKNEFNKFGGLLEKAQKNIQTANNQLEEVMGKRTRAIQHHLRSVEALPSDESQPLILTAENAEVSVNE